MAIWRGEVKKLARVTAAEVALWNRLCIENDYLRNPFFSFTFFACVARAKPSARVCLLYRDSELAGFFPFQFAHPLAQALGAGERIGGGLNDFSGAVVGATTSLSPADLLRCAGLRHFTVSHLEAHQGRIGLSGERLDPGFRLTLDRGAEPYWSDVGARHKDKLKNLLNRERKIERDFGSVSFVFDDPDARSVLDLVMIEKRAQYARTGAGDALARDWMQQCLWNIAAQRDELCRPIASSLYIDGKWAALHFGMRSRHVLHYWFPVYSPDFANLSPGLILLRKIINHCAKHGLTEIDFGEGDAPYKRWLGTEEYANGSGEWIRPGLRSFAYKAFRSASWRLTTRRKTSPD